MPVPQTGMTKAGFQRSFTYTAPPGSWADWDEAILQPALLTNRVNNKHSVYTTVSWPDRQEPWNEKSVFPVQHLPTNKITREWAVTPDPGSPGWQGYINRRNAKGDPWL